MLDFIEVYPEAVSKNDCRRIIERFESCGQATRGRTGSGVDTKLKDSFDIGLAGNTAWQDVDKVLQEAAFAGLQQYVRKYFFALIGAVALRVQNPDSAEVKLIDADIFPTIEHEQYVDLLAAVFRPGAVNLQKYIAGQGGYPHWHSEIYPIDRQCEPLHRVLLWTIYLNDVPQAGETEFFYQERKIQPRAGDLLIAPTGFTHTHRGNTPIGGDKYIATSWVLYQRSETIYGK